jgi:Protein of unknown function (DUF3592)
MLGAGVLLALFAVYVIVGPDSRKVALLKRLETEGVVASAKVTNKSVEEYLSYDNSGSRVGRRSAVAIFNEHNRRAESATVNYLYFVDVEFKTAQGQTFRSKKNIPGRHFDGIAIGAQVQILYHPEDPAEVSRLPNYTSPYKDMSEADRTFVAVLLLIAGMLLWYGRPIRNIESGPSWDVAAGNRIENVRAARGAEQQAPSRRVASARLVAPKGFGRAARRA